MIKYIVFDLGRVLFDWRPAEVAEKMAKLHDNFSPCIADITKTDVWKDYDRGIMTNHEVADRFADRYSKMMVLDFIQESFSTFVPLEEGMLLWESLLQRGFPVYILSNLPIDLRGTIFHKNPFLHDSKGAVFSCDCGFIKPEPIIYETLLSNYDLTPEETLFIDDMEENIQAARQIGMHGIVYKDYEDALKTIEEHIRSPKLK